LYTEIEPNTVNLKLNIENKKRQILSILEKENYGENDSWNSS